jgi:hypothetical protein
VPPSPSPWVSLFVLVGIPLLITSKSGLDWLLKWPLALGPWALLVAVAAAGISRGPWFGSPALISLGGIALFAAPLVQAILFVVLYCLFVAVVHRRPASFNAVRYRHRDEVHNAFDAIFWSVVFLSVFVGILVFCFSLGVELPPRHKFR